ncbi:AAA family ATPase [Bradyrhizobium sp. USDA 10063]
MTALPLKFFDECSNEPAKPWLIKGVLALDEDSSWYGPAGGLKSSLLTDIAVHGAAGRNWRGFKAKMKFGTVYFALERAGLQRRRLAAYAKRDGHAGLPIAVADQIIDLTDEACVQTVVETIKAAEERFGILVGLVIFDTYAKAVAAGGGDEDKAQHVNLVAANLKRIHDRLGHPVHLATIGHTGKDETKGERGSSAKTGHIDLGVQISGDKVKTATITKANDQAEGVLTSFMGEEVVIGEDEDGDALTAFIVSATPVQAPPERASRLSDNQVNALDTLKSAIKEQGQKGAVEVHTWKEELFRRGVLDRDAPNPREPFRRLKAALIKTGRIEENNGMVRFTSTNAIPSIASSSIVPAAGGNSSLTMPPIPIR